MNSVAFTERAITHLQFENVSKVYTYLDRDRAGQESLTRFEQGPWDVQDASGFYQGHKDVNDYLQAQMTRPLEARPEPSRDTSRDASRDAPRER